MALSRSQRLKVANTSPVDKVREKPLEIKLFNQTDNQACMVIPKKYVAKASDRNRLRRTCLEIVRKTFKNRQIGGMMIRVYTQPDDLEVVPTVLSRCIQKLRCSL